MDNTTNPTREEIQKLSDNIQALNEYAIKSFRSCTTTQFMMSLSGKYIICPKPDAIIYDNVKPKSS